MKTYRCKETKSEGEDVFFEKGNVYDVVTLSGWPALVDEFGDTWDIDDDLLRYFDTGNEAYNDYEAEEYSYFLQAPTFSKGCAIGVLITAAAFAWWALTWRS